MAEDWVPDIVRLQECEDTEWLRVEREYCGRLFAYALRRTGNHQTAEDVVQETMLGAVRGIGDFDPRYSFEQYLFGICRNRTIDQMRRRKVRTVQAAEDDEGFGGLESFAGEGETPSAIVRGMELSARARELLATILRDWVEENWEQGEYLRLSVIEALFYGGERNRDIWRRFELRDETAVAGIKFRALKRLRQLAAVRESGSDLLPLLARAEETDHRLLDMDVQAVWREARISCPERHWLAQLAAGKLAEGPASFLRFHLDEMKCPWCRANYDDLSSPERERELMELLRRVQQTTDSVLVRRRSSEGFGAD